MFVWLLRLFIAALWSLAGKGLTSWLLCVMFNFVFVTFSCGVLGQVWYLIVSIPSLCRISYYIEFTYVFMCFFMFLLPLYVGLIIINHCVDDVLL